MATPTIKTLLLFGLLFFCSLIEAALKLGQIPHPEPQGRLRVRLDHAFATRSTSANSRDHHWMVSSHLVFNEPIGDKISDRQLIQIAIDAYNEIDPEIKQWIDGTSGRALRALKGATPGAMNALLFGNEIILVSSYKGGGSNFVVDFPDSEMSRLLEQCTVTFQRTQEQTAELDDHQPGVGTSHSHGAHCAEIMAFHLYARRWPDQPLSLRKDSPKTTTVAFLTDDQAVKPIAPCDVKPDEATPEKAHGCAWVVRQQNVKYIGEGTGAPYDLNELGITRYGQLRTCD